MNEILKPRSWKHLSTAFPPSKIEWLKNWKPNKKTNMNNPIIEIGIDENGNAESCISDLANLPQEKFGVIMQLLKQAMESVEGNYEVRFNTAPKTPYSHFGEALTPTEQIRQNYKPKGAPDETGAPEISRPISKDKL